MEGAGADNIILVGLDRPTRWMRARAWLLLKLLPIVLAISGLPLAIIALVAAVQGLWIRVFNMHANAYSAVRDWVAGLDPVPEPPTRNEEIANRIVELVRDFDYYLLVLLVTGIITLVSVWLVLCWLLRTPMKRLVYKMQGIEYEAMRPGSDFIDAKVPAYQVTIQKPGGLRPSHVGYGVRVTHNLLAVPTHVIQGLEEVIVRGPLNSLAFRPNLVPSRVHSDLTYVHIESAKWIRLGTPIAKLMPTLPGMFGRCYGPRGYSMGRLSRSRQINFMMVYEGSTEPGMSGAPYVIGDAVVGMHCGVLGDANSGISAALIKAELQQMVSNEAVHGGISSSAAADSAAYFGNKVEAQVKAWDEKDLHRAVKSAYSVDWNVLNDMPVDYNRQLDFENKRPTPVKVKQTLNVPLDQPLARALQQVEQINQNDESGQSFVQILGPPAEVSELAALTQRVIDLEIRVASLETPAAKVGHVNCSYCGSTVAAKRLPAHVRKVHFKSKPGLTGESAIPSDSKRIVKTAPFLEKKPSTKKSRPKLTNTSSSSVKDELCQSLAEALSKMTESQNRIERLLASLPVNTVGPSSAVTPN